MSQNAINELIADLNEMVSPANIERAGLNAFRVHFNRIFIAGLDSSGNPIGSYSTKPIYVNPKDSPKTFQTKGKTGKSKFKSGKPHKTGYFQGGYKGFRATIGRKTDIVNLTLFGDMRRNYIAGPTRSGYVFGFVSRSEADKAKKNEQHFRKSIFDASAQEADVFVEELLKPLT